MMYVCSCHLVSVGRLPIFCHDSSQCHLVIFCWIDIVDVVASISRF